MANGKTIHEVRSLLADDKASFPTKTGLRLTLAMMAELYELMQTMDGRVVIIEKQSFGVWVRKHPVIALFIATAFTALFISDMRHALYGYVSGLEFLP